MLLSWNTRGTGRPNKKRATRETINRSNCTVIYLQETKQNHMNQQLKNHICGSRFEERTSLDAVGSTGGLLTCWIPNVFDGNLVMKGVYSLTINLIC